MEEDYIKEIINESFNKQYEYVKFLGEGAYARVYLVRHKFLEDKRAMKIVKEALSDNYNIKEVFHEVKVATQLRHKNIINIYDAGIITQEANEYAYFVLEYVNGGDLEEYRLSYKKNNLRLPVIEVLKIIQQISMGLKTLHTSKPPIIHRDLKTGNILLSYDQKGQILIKISDFGIASEITSSSQQLEVAGTMPYMAPECFGKNFSTQSDIYAVGVIFYQLLTDKFPYHADQYDKDDLIQSLAWKNRYVETSQFNEEVPDYVEEVVKKCLSINPSDRYSDAVKLEEAVNQAISKYFDEHPQKGSVDTSDNELSIPINPMISKAFKYAKQENKLSDAVTILEHEISDDDCLKECYHRRLTLWKSDRPDIKMVMEAFQITLRGKNYNIGCDLLLEAFAYNPGIKEEYSHFYTLWGILGQLEKDRDLFNAIQKLDECMQNDKRLNKMYANLITILKTFSTNVILSESKRLAQEGNLDDASKLLEFLVVSDNRVGEEYSYKLSLWKQNLEM